jgi:hypothetical protein
MLCGHWFAKVFIAVLYVEAAILGALSDFLSMFWNFK